MRGSKPAVILRPISEREIQSIPEIPPSALAEIEQDRKTGRLVKLGNTPEDAVAALRKLSKRRR
jgi:hypothetical protein